MLTAAVIAGGDPQGKLEQALGVTSKALLPVAGRTMLARVVEAVRQADGVSQVLVVSRRDAPLPPGDWGEVVELPAEHPGFANALLCSAEHVGPGQTLLISTADLPLLTTGAVNSLLAFGREANVGLVYSVADADESLRAFPGSHRTVVRLRDGRFTGGNVVLIRSDVALRQRDLIDAAFGRRKSVVGLARLLGPLFVLRLALGLLDTQQLAQRAGDMLQCTAAVWKSPYPEIGFDVDRPGDLDAAAAALAARAGR